MFEKIGNSTIYKNLNLSKNLMHSYLFYSSDRELNNIIALFFAKTLLCDKHISCGECPACRQFDAHTHPDLTIINQDTVKVEDISKIINKLNTKPISAEKKVFVILNAETINEISQNKLLKSLEEPNPSNIFIMTTTKTDKILNTVMSRLNKIYLPYPDNNDKKIFANELNKTGIDISKYLDTNFSMTEMINLSSNTNYQAIIDNIYMIFEKLNTTADIPNIVNSINLSDKSTFFMHFQDIILSAIKDDYKKYARNLIDSINAKFPKKSLLKSLPLIEDAYKKQSSNVNFFYILDNLLFNMLKEKFLCK